MSKTTKKIIIVILIIFIIGIAFYFLFFRKNQETPASTLLPTSTPTQSPTKIFPSFDAFIKEVKNNCSEPSEKEFSIAQLTPPEKRDFMRSFLQQELQQKTGEMNMEVYELDLELPTETNWFCIGISLSSSNKDVWGNTHEESLERWGKWSIPVYLAYWSKDGLVTYEYKPIMPNL